MCAVCETPVAEAVGQCGRCRNLLSLPGAVRTLDPSAEPADPSNVPSPSSDPVVPGDAGVWSSEALPLEGTTWRLRHQAGPEFVAVPPDVAAWVTLRAGQLRGWTGCRDIVGSYGRMGQALRFSPDARGEASCPASARAVDADLSKGLVRAASFSIEPGPRGPTLILRDAADLGILRFEPDHVGTLTDETWYLSTLTLDGEPQPALPGPTAELTFTSDRDGERDRRERGSLVGSSGCNGILGSYRREGDRLQVRDVETTGAPCPDDLAAQESALLAVLTSDALELDLPPDRLVLSDGASGDSLELVRSAPLEGSTWLLRGIAGGGRPDTPVTLRLEAGLLTGEGPCGPYQGGYTTDGRFIRFHDLRGTDGAGCEARARQRTLLLALERAVLLEQEPPALRLLDAAGALVATFIRPPGP